MVHTILCKNCLHSFDSNEHSKCPMCGTQHDFLPGEKESKLIVDAIIGCLKRSDLTLLGNYPIYFLYRTGGNFKLICSFTFTETGFQLNQNHETETFEYADPKFNINVISKTIETNILYATN